MPPLRRALHDVRAATALARARPAYAAGLRAAIATVVPLLADLLLHTGGGTWMSLVGFTGALADKGGAYRTRAETMGALVAGSMAAVALGTLASGRVAAAVPLTFAVAAVCGLARVWGNAGASVGGSVLNTFVIALAAPPHTGEEALARAGFALVGGLWAMLLSLVLWPLRPYRPVRVAVAACYRALAGYADVIAARTAAAASGATVPDGRGLPAGSAEVRGALEAARAELAVIRRGRPGESARGERLLVLHESVDQQLGHLAALTDALGSIPAAERDAEAQAAAAEAVAGLAATARAVAERILEERATVPAPLAWGGRVLAARSPAAASEAARTHYHEAAALLERLAQYAGVAAATTAALDDGRGAPALPGLPEVEEPAPAPHPLAALREILAPDSLVLRYALRVAIVTAVAVALTTIFGLKRGYWVTITAVIILQPYTGATTRKALQRVLGTVLGGVLTAALGALFHDPVAILPLAFVFAALSVALLPLNYAAYSIFLTPTFVLLAEASAGDWHLAGVRILNTVLGGVLALLGARLLWPVPEWRRLPAFLAAALRGNRAYLHDVVARYGDRSAEAGRALRAARREVGLATVNAEESFQRLMGEHGHETGELAPIMAFLTYTRRLTASVAALAVARHSLDAPDPAPLAPFAGMAEAVLDDLADALAEGRAPAPLPPLALGEAGEAGLPPLLRARVVRMARQIRTLHDEVARYLARGAGGVRQQT